MNSDQPPGVIMSSDSTLYIIYTTTGPTNGFKATWEKVPSKIITFCVGDIIDFMIADRKWLNDLPPSHTPNLEMLSYKQILVLDPT